MKILCILRPLIFAFLLAGICFVSSANAQSFPLEIVTSVDVASLVSEPAGTKVVEAVPKGTKGEVLESQYGFNQGCADYWYKIKVVRPDGAESEGWVHGSQTEQKTEASKQYLGFRANWDEFLGYLLAGAMRQVDGFIHPDYGLSYIQLDKDLNPEALHLESFSQISGTNFSGKEVQHNRIFATVHAGLVRFHKLLRNEPLIHKDDLCCFKRKGCFNDLRFGQFTGLSFVAGSKLERDFGTTDLDDPGDEVYHSEAYQEYCDALDLEARATHRVLIASEDASGCNWVVSCFLFSENEKWYILAIDSHQCVRVKKENEGEIGNLNR